MPFVFADKIYDLTGTFAFLVAMLLYYNKSRRNLIFNKYSNETKKVSKKGDIAVISYKCLSILVFIAEAFFIHGYLPSIWLETKCLSSSASLRLAQGCLLFFTV